MNQLFLKYLIFHRNDTSILPLDLTNLMFVHRENRYVDEQKTTYEVALYVENNVLCFLNLRNDKDKAIFYERLENYGVADIYDDHVGIVARQEADNVSDQRKPYDAILGLGLCVEIQDALEALLYEYEKILQRMEEADEYLDLDAFKLAEKFDDLVDSSHKPKRDKDYLVMQGYLQQMNMPKTKIDKEAFELYNTLHEYDAYLDSLKNRYDSLSFSKLMEDEEIRQKIGMLFGGTRLLHNQYKKLGRYAGVREADVVPVYEGIWYTEDRRYVVGDANGMPETVARAHRVRQFVVHAGNDHFEIEQLLEMMSVQFVRLRQYTVRPYPFHLIDLYIDNYLQYTQPIS